MPESNESFLERMKVAEIVTTTVLLSELGEWEKYAARFADEVTFDYSPSLGGGPQVWSRDTMVAFSKSSMAAFDVTQHQITNMLVEWDGETMVSRSYQRATHRIGNDLWVRGGIYIHRLKRDAAGDWKIYFQKRISLYEEGDASIFARATAKMQTALPSLDLKDKRESAS